EEKVIKWIPYCLQSLAMIAGAVAFIAKHSSGFTSASSTFTYPEALIIAHGLCLSINERKLVSSSIFTSSRPMAINGSKRCWHICIKACPNVPVFPIIKIGLISFAWLPQFIDSGFLISFRCHHPCCENNGWL